MSFLGVATFVKVDAPPYNGKFVFYMGSHCFSRIDGLFLDTDPAFPLPVRSMEELGISHFDCCFNVLRWKLFNW